MNKSKVLSLGTAFILIGVVGYLTFYPSNSYSPFPHKWFYHVNGKSEWIPAEVTPYGKDNLFILEVPSNIRDRKTGKNIHASWLIKDGGSYTSLYLVGDDTFLSGEVKCGEDTQLTGLMWVKCL